VDGDPAFFLGSLMLAILAKATIELDPLLVQDAVDGLKGDVGIALAVGGGAFLMGLVVAYAGWRLEKRIERLERLMDIEKDLERNVLEVQEGGKTIMSVTLRQLVDQIKATGETVKMVDTDGGPRILYRS